MKIELDIKIELSISEAKKDTDNYDVDSSIKDIFKLTL